MKRTMFLISLCLCIAFSAMAQNVEEEYSAAYATKRGVYLLPQAGDFALGVDANPFLRYVGNIFTSAENRAPRFRGVDYTLYGKYFLKDNRALRARLTLDVSNETCKGDVPNDEVADEDPMARLTDIQRKSSAGFNLGVGYEFRRGNGRVQGFWGGEVSFGYSGGKTTYDYANLMTEDNQVPSTYYFDSNYYDPPYGSMRVRTTEDKWGNQISFGLGGFVGVEYFFAPQISLGGQIGLGFGFITNGQNQTTTERWGDEDLILETSKNQYSWLAQSINLRSYTSGSIFLMFHF